MNKDLFSQRLRELREDKGYVNQSQFAEEYNDRYHTKRRDEAGGNISFGGILGTIKHYENPNYPGMPRLDIVANMCELLDCDIDYLTGSLDYKTHNSEFVCQYTGLSEKSIEVLRFLTSTLTDKEDETSNKRIIALLNMVLESTYPAVVQYRKDETALNRILKTRYPEISIDLHGNADTQTDNTSTYSPATDDPCPIPVQNIFSTMYQFICPEGSSLSFLDGDKRITVSGAAATVDSNSEPTIFTVNELKRITLFDRIKKQLTALAEKEKNNG